MNTLQPRKELFVKSQANLTDDAPVPDIVTNWLSRLSLLYGVPFQYLVPNEDMLPMESIRFFYYDQNWINAVVDGAMSIGRVIKKDMEHDEVFQNKLNSEVGKNISATRAKLLKKPVTTVINTGDPGFKTGFLLRSVIVEGWPGLEVKAYKDKEKKQMANILRLDHLSKDVLLCIFDSEFQELELCEPAESMHFGADMDDGKTTKMLRGLGEGNVSFGEEMPDVIANICFKGSDNRTVDIVSTVNEIKTKLKTKGELGDHFSSAEFAVQMVESAQMGVFNND